MAFTETQVAKVMLHLRYPAATWAKSTIEAALSNVTDLSTEIETQVSDIITDLDNLYSDISTFTIDNAGTQVTTSGVVYFPTLAIAEKKSRYRMLQEQLATITQLTNYARSSSRVSLG
ncbi:MAG: hypothetical protein [Caudoviricetes sp.]|nr:MAG: hypothetical protein [Caudoviricetes sp.]